jgi:O-antigen/teichoic acid export membrane protein
MTCRIGVPCTSLTQGWFVISKHNINTGNPSLAEQTGGAFLWRSFGLGAEKLIFLLRLLVLARLIAPEDFGLIAIGMKATAIMTRMTDFGLVAALIQRPSREKAYLDTAWTISLVRGFGINVVLFVAAPYIATAFDEPAATNIIRVLALATLIESAASIEIARITRELQFRRIALVRLGGALLNAIVSIGYAGSLGAWALVWGTIAGAGAYALGTFIAAPYRPAFRWAVSARDRVFEFGRWIFAIGVLGVLAEGLLRWIVTTRLGLAELGLYFLAARLAYLPAQLTTDIFGQVAFPVYARLQDEPAKLARVFRSMVTSLTAVLLPAGLIFFTLIPGLVEHVLGARWDGSTAVMQAIVLATIIGIIGDAAIPLLKGIGTPARVAALEIVRISCLVLSAWLLAGPYGLLGMGLAEIIAAVVSQAAVVYVLLRVLDRPFWGLKSVSLAIAAASLCGALLAGLTARNLPGVGGLVLAAVVGGLGSGTIGIALDRMFRLGILPVLLEPFPRLASIAQRYFGSV